MHIFIDARGLENRIDGIGQFAVNILSRLPAYGNTRFTVLVRDDLKCELPTARHIAYIRTPTRRFTIGEAGKIRSLVSTIGPDLYFNLSSYIPDKIPCPSCMMLYDLLSTHFKGHFQGMGAVKGFLARRYFRYRVKNSIVRARKIITISNYSRDQICSRYRVSPSKILVVYGGVDARYCANGDRDKQNFIAETGLKEKFFLHVGNLKPYKNIKNIIRSYAAFAQKYPASDIGFAFTGSRGRGYREAVRMISSLKLGDKVKLLDYVDKSKMPLLYGSSTGLFFPSKEEGFGLPVLEAMCCRTPVVTSRGTATEEIAGGHAFLVEPRSTGSLLTGLEYLAFAEKDARKIDAAFGYAKSFTWDKAVDAIITALLRA
jgi:glycosyltransferase involved in cell wall biosynthesis